MRKLTRLPSVTKLKPAVKIESIVAGENLFQFKAASAGLATARFHGMRHMLQVAGLRVLIIIGINPMHLVIL